MKNTLPLLIVDDQQRARQSLRALVETNFPQVNVCEASDGIEALMRVELCPPQLIIMDARMPQLDGIETTRLLKAKNPHLKIIILTLYDSYRKAAGTAGADAFLLKMENPKPLLETITDMLEPAIP